MNELHRLLGAKEAAQYCRIPKSKFKGVCPVRPIKLHEATNPVYDIYDLDKWIDSIKNGCKEEESDDDMLNRL